jgi:hypothetical protein
MEREVDNQVAAPAETRNTQLAPSENRSQRVRMEGWRQWRLGENNFVEPKNGRTHLTPTGLLMEGVLQSLKSHRVNFEVNNLKPFPYLARKGPKQPSKLPNLDGELMAVFARHAKSIVCEIRALQRLDSIVDCSL